MVLTGRKAFLLALTVLFCNVTFAAPGAHDILKRAVADPALRETLVREGKAAAFFCANCHGDAGTSRYPDVPNLAGQNPAYIVNQIEAFLSGKRRNEFMQGLMKVLGDRDKAAIASYYATAPTTAATATPGPQAAQGADHFKRLCAACHHADAHGGDVFPRIAGQRPEYLRLSLKRYLNKTGERNYPEMTNAVTKLGEQNIDAVVDYLASLN